MINEKLEQIKLPLAVSIGLATGLGSVATAEGAQCSPNQISAIASDAKTIATQSVRYGNEIDRFDNGNYLYQATSNYGGFVQTTGLVGVKGRLAGVEKPDTSNVFSATLKHVKNPKNPSNYNFYVISRASGKNLKVSLSTPKSYFNFNTVNCNPVDYQKAKNISTAAANIVKYAFNPYGLDPFK